MSDPWRGDWSVRTLWGLLPNLHPPFFFLNAGRLWDLLALPGKSVPFCQVAELVQSRLPAWGSASWLQTSSVPLGKASPTRAAVILREHLLHSDSNPSSDGLMGSFREPGQDQVPWCLSVHMSRRQPMVEGASILTLPDIPAALFPQLCCTSQWIE